MAIEADFQWADFVRLVPEAQCSARIKGLLLHRMRRRLYTAERRLQKGSVTRPAETQSEAPTIAFAEIATREWRRVRQYLQDAAYYEWLSECQRVGGTVHCNDQDHWFRAEIQVVNQMARPSVPRKPSSARTAKVDSRSTRSANSGCHPNAIRDKAAARREQTSMDGVRTMSTKSHTEVADELDPSIKVDCLGWINGGELEKYDPHAKAFRNRIVVTDFDEQHVLFVVNTPVEVGAVIALPRFQKAAEERFGADLQLIEHNGSAGTRVR